MVMVSGYIALSQWIQERPGITPPPPPTSLYWHKTASKPLDAIMLVICMLYQGDWWGIQRGCEERVNQHRSLWSGISLLECHLYAPLSLKLFCFQIKKSTARASQTKNRNWQIISDCSLYIWLLLIASFVKLNWANPLKFSFLDLNSKVHSPDFTFWYVCT